MSIGKLSCFRYGSVLRELGICRLDDSFRRISVFFDVVSLVCRFIAKEIAFAMYAHASLQTTPRLGVIRESKHVLRSMSDLRGEGKTRIASHDETLAEDETVCNRELWVGSDCDKASSRIRDDGLEPGF